MRIAIVTCYDQNDYIRARGLREALGQCSGVETVIIRNTLGNFKGLGKFLRYIEVPLKITWARLTGKIDAYVITFRGYEMLLFMCLTGVRKPIIFDEMINFVEYYHEHGQIIPDTPADRWLRRFYRWQIKRCWRVLADTQAHAEFSAGLTGVPLKKFRVLPVAADETLFRPKQTKATKPFTVFYYGNGMTPLHGLQYVLEAAILLRGHPEIRFNIVGGREKGERACADAVARGAHIDYETWVVFDQLPNRMRAAGVCLGGPFGQTLQSQFVVTGKTMQALACAAPVLVGRNPAGSMLKNKHNCLSVPPANAQKIAEVILWASEHPAELRDIGHRGRALYERYFAQRIVDEGLQQMIEELTHARTH